MKINSIKEFVNLISEKLKNQSVDGRILGITMEREFFYKLENPYNISEPKQVLGVPIIILPRPSYTYKENYVIHYANCVEDVA